MKRLILISLALLALLPSGALAKGFPETIQLPDDFQPEGIAVGHGFSFYAGSVTSGAVFRGSLRSGSGAVLVPPQTGRAATGMKVDRRNRLFVAGAGSKHAYVYDARTGQDIRVYDLPASGFINDVVVTRDAAYFTDSSFQVLYRIPFGRHGRLGDVETVPITGDLVYTMGFNANGIEATRDGRILIIVKSNTGQLFAANAHSGETREIALDKPVTNGDGILLAGQKLYVVQNQDEKVAVVRLDRRLASGRVTRFITDKRLDVPTTLARFGPWLYAVNARFPPNGDNLNPTEDVIRLPKM
jgi:sugar lactone lactonase YvrE